MELILIGMIYASLLFIIFFEGQPDTPVFFSLPHTPVDYMRIVMHSLEFALITWPPVGIVRCRDLQEAATTEMLLVIVLALVSLVSMSIAPRFTKTGFRFAFYTGLLTVPGLFLFS